jgi:hypothetical protein
MELTVSDDSADVVWTMNGEPPADDAALQFEISYGKPSVPPATWRALPCAHRKDGYGETCEYTTTLGGLSAGSSVAVRVRVTMDGTVSDWSEKSDPIQLAGEKVSLASAAGGKLADGAAAKLGS